MKDVKKEDASKLVQNLNIIKYKKAYLNLAFLYSTAIFLLIFLMLFIYNFNIIIL